MTFKTKVQKIIMESAEKTNLKEIKDEITKSIQVDLMNRFDKIIEDKLDNWKDKTREACVREIVQEELQKHKLIQ